MATAFNGTTAYGVSGTLALSGQNRISLSFWLNWTAFPNNDQFACEYSAPRWLDNNGTFVVDPNSSSPAGVWLNGLRTTNTYSATSNRPTAGAWHHHAILLDGSGPTPDITHYIDNVLQSSGAGSATAANFGNYALYLMSRAGTSLFGAGALFQFAIYAGLLTPANIASLFGHANPLTVAGGPLYYWTLAIGSGTEANLGSGGTAAMTYNNTTFVADPFSTATAFNGTNAYGVSGTLALSGQNQISLSFWANWTTFANNDALICEYSTPSWTVNNGAFAIDPNTSVPAGVWVNDLRTTANYNTVTSPRPSAGVWHHHAVLYDGSGTSPNIVHYIDGALVSSAGAAAAAANFGNYALYLMSRSGTSLFGAGALFQFAIYAGLLTPANIASLATMTPPLSVAGGPLYYWTLAIGSGTEANLGSGGTAAVTLSNTTSVAGPTGVPPNENTSKLVNFAVLESGGENTSKLVNFAVLDTTAENLAKTNAYAVLQQAGENLAKTNAYAVLQQIGPNLSKLVSYAIVNQNQEAVSKLVNYAVLGPPTLAGWLTSTSTARGALTVPGALPPLTGRLTTTSTARGALTIPILVHLTGRLTTTSTARGPVTIPILVHLAGHLAASTRGKGVLSYTVGISGRLATRASGRAILSVPPPPVPPPPSLAESITVLAPRLDVFEIPLRGGAPSFQTVRLSGVRYQLSIHWCDPLGVWVLDLADEDGNPLVSGVPMVTGLDLLAQYTYMNFGGALVAQSDFDWRVPPTFNNLGRIGHLYWIPYVVPAATKPIFPLSPQDWRSPVIPTEPRPVPPPSPEPPGPIVLDGTTSLSSYVGSGTGGTIYTRDIGPLTTTLANDILVLWVVINAEGRPTIGVFPTITPPLVDTVGLVWQRRLSFTDQVVNGMSGSDIYTLNEIWWARMPTPGTVTVTVTTTTPNPAWFNVCFFAVNGLRASAPWDIHPSLPAIAKNLTSTNAKPEVRGVSSNAAHGVGLVFEASYDSQALSGGCFQNSAAVPTWDGNSWDFNYASANPTRPIAATQNIQVFIGLETLTGCFGHVFTDAPIVSGTFATIDYVGWPNQNQWVIIGDVMVGA